MNLRRNSFCALVASICFVGPRSTTGLDGEYVTQDMLTRCPVASASLATCAQLKGINLDFLDANSCIDCLTGSSSTSSEQEGTVDCDKVDEHVCQSVDSCSTNCSSIAGACSGQFGDLLNCQLEKGVPIGNCTVTCSSAPADLARPRTFWGSLVVSFLLLCFVA